MVVDPGFVVEPKCTIVPIFHHEWVI